jgi:exopolysaccharide biosynthesis protein
MIQRQILVAMVTAFLLLPLGAYGILHFQRPPQTDEERRLFPGITYNRNARSQPRPVMIHIVNIDLKTAGLKVLVTPKTPNKSRTTSEFLREFNLKLAINASYFVPFYEHTPWDYYPRSGDGSFAMGEVIANGNRYSQPRSQWAVLCMSRANIANIVAAGTCPQGTLNAVAGRELLVSDGKPVPELFTSGTQQENPYPRVAAGIDRQGEKLWLIVVDGKQPLYSEGLTKLELAKLFAKLGVDRALNFDGGGSTTLVMAASNGFKVLNAPIHAKLPTTERPVANHIGFYIP